MRINNQEILLPTTMVGSYPRPNWLRGKVFGEYDEPDYIDYAAKEAYVDAVRLCVDDQIRAGIDLVCDGQQYYESETTHEYGQVFHFWGHHLKGFARWGDPVVIEAYKKFHAPAVVGPVEWVRPVYGATADVTVEAAGDRPVKLAVQGPIFLAYACTDRHYKDVKPLALDIAKAFNAEFKDLVRRGVAAIQIHEPLTYYTEEPWFIEVLNVAFEGVQAHRIWHICYGNQGGNPGVTVARGQGMFPFAFQADVDEVHIETMRRGPGDLEHVKELPSHMSLGVGVIDVKSLVIEDPEDIAARLLLAAEKVPADRIAVSTDCGLLNLKREHAQLKIQALVAGTRIARERLNGG